MFLHVRRKANQALRLEKNECLLVGLHVTPTLTLIEPIFLDRSLIKSNEIRIQ